MHRRQSTSLRRPLRIVCRAGLLLVIAGAALGQCSALGSARASRIARFNSIEGPRVARARSDSLDNEEGKLAWEWSYDLTALAEMLSATGDTLYARWFIDLGEVVAAARDDRRGFEDTWRHRVYKAWGSTRYSDSRTIWEVHTGMIAAPLAQFAAVVLADSTLAARYGDDARRFRTLAGEALAIHDAQYRVGPDTTEAYFLRRNLRLPLNQVCALARAWLFMIAADDSSGYDTRLDRVATYVRNRMRIEETAYVWSYAPHLTGPGTDFDDVVHGAITADFAVLCAERQRVFTGGDIDRLAATLLGRLIRPDGTIAKDMSGEGEAREPAQILLWGRLARHDRDVARGFENMLDTTAFSDSTRSIEALALAHLIAARLSRAD